MGRYQSIENRAKLLFANERLDHRFRMFEAITLPFLKEQARATPNFRCVILKSPLMPSAYQERLKSATTDCQAITLQDVSPSDSLGLLMKKATLEVVPERASRVVTYRLDDDDAPYVHHASRIIDECVQSNLENRILSFPNGILLRRDQAPHSYEASFIYYMNSSVGISFVTRKSKIEEFQTIFHLGGHGGLVKRHPATFIGDPKAWLYTVHGKNDSRYDGGEDRQPIANSTNTAPKRDRVQKKVSISAAELPNLFGSEFGFLKYEQMNDAFFSDGTDRAET